MRIVIYSILVLAAFYTGFYYLKTQSYKREIDVRTQIIIHEVDGILKQLHNCGEACKKG